MKQIIVLVAGLMLSYQVSAAPTKKQVLEHYADLAHAMYEDALITARDLQKSVNGFIARPTEQNLVKAREAWIAARHPYQQTEVYRFGNAIVDDWEGKVNAWPLDEGLIDYVHSSYGAESDENPYYAANIIANRELVISGRTIDASHITKEFLSGTLHELDEIESNVATGYHAVEFMLWGQDLNGTGSGAGSRKASDFDTKNCSNGHCDRRAEYLKATTDLLVDELQWMTTQWDKDGKARKDLVKDGENAGLAIILTGMGSLSYGELAGERMKLGVMLHDPEEEHDCFSDNTHWSHFNDALGIKNVYTGTYTRIDGSKLTGPSISDLVKAKDSAVDKELRKSIINALFRMRLLVDSAELNGIAYDQLLAAGNSAGNKKIMDAVDALLVQTKAIEKAVTTLNLESIAFEGSNSLDNPSSIN